MRYRLESVLGEGAHGTVWRARDADTSALVAVKKIQLSVRERRDVGAEQHRQNVLREAQTMRHLSQHPNVCHCYFVPMLDFATAACDGRRRVLSGADHGTLAHGSW